MRKERRLVLDLFLLARTVTKAKQRLAIRAGDDVVKETQLETEGSLISAQ